MVFEIAGIRTRVGISSRLDFPDAGESRLLDSFGVQGTQFDCELVIGRGGSHEQETALSPGVCTYSGIGESCVFEPAFNRLSVYLGEQSVRINKSILTVAIKELLSFVAIRKGLFTLHSSMVLINGRVVAFLGVSGSGKTTLARALSDVGTVLSDEYNIVELLDSGAVAHATPFTKLENEDMCAKCSGSLNELFAITKGPTTRTDEISNRAQFLALMGAAICPPLDEFSADTIMSGCQRLRGAARVRKLVVHNPRDVQELLFSQDLCTYNAG